MNKFHIDNDIYFTKIEQFSKCMVIYSVCTKINHTKELRQEITKIQPEYIITDDKTTYINNDFFKNCKIIHAINPFQNPIKLIKCLTKQKNSISEDNKNKTICFEPNEVIVYKSNRRRKSNIYEEHIVKTDLGNIILTTKNRKLRKDRVRKKYE